ncbi:MAG: hypothetical protein AB1717_05485 [Pseudomonadota bacterium]
MDANDLAYLEKLGYEGVLAEMAKGEGRLGRPGSPIREEIEHWLALQRINRESASDVVRNKREDETLAIAKEANRLASEANSIARLEAAAASRSARYAMYAAIIAATIMIVDNKDQILALIFHP